VLLGENERHDTTQAPASVTDARPHWITRYLNASFRQLPEQVEIVVREQPGRREPSQLTRIDGERHHIEQHAVATAVLGDELYDVLPHTRGGYGRLQDFGIRFGYERVVLHLEPHAQAGRLEANTARTMLLLDHDPLPWSRWGGQRSLAQSAFASAGGQSRPARTGRLASSGGTLVLTERDG
jgi:hypothetical protein